MTTITDLADVRDGDIVTVRIGNDEYIGPARVGIVDRSRLWFTDSVLRDSNGDPGPVVTFVSATREVPDLPTVVGAVILDVVDRLDRRYDVGVRDGYGHWNLVHPRGRITVSPDAIASWTPAEVCATRERVTR